MLAGPVTMPEGYRTRISRRDLCGVMILIIAERIFHALWTRILKFNSISPWSRIRRFLIFCSIVFFFYYIHMVLYIPVLYKR